MNDIFVKTDKPSDSYRKNNTVELTADELQQRREARKLEQENNPHYLKGSSNSYKNSSSYHNISNNNEDDFESIPVTELNIPVALEIPGLASSKKYLNLNAGENTGEKRHKRRSKKKLSNKSNNDILARLESPFVIRRSLRCIFSMLYANLYLVVCEKFIAAYSVSDKRSNSSEDERGDTYPSQLVNTGVGELPPGAELSDGDDYYAADMNDPHRALDIDLDMPLRDDERLPVLEHRVVENSLTSEVPDINKNKKDKVLLKCLKIIQFPIYLMNT